MVSYSLEEAIEKLAPIGSPFADEIGEPPNPWRAGRQEDPDAEA